MVDFFYLFIVVFIVMRHRKKGKSLGRNSSQRKSMFKNLMKSIIKHEIIKTTLPKAKEIRRFLEPILTVSKIDNLKNRRLIFSRIGDKKILGKLFFDLGYRFKNRNGGYTRILKCGYRKGDGAPMAFIELVDRK